MSSPSVQASTATSTNSAHTITVACTDQGTITELHFAASVYAYGADTLASEILRLAQRSTLVAKAHRREMLAAAGLAPVLLDRLALPSPEAVTAELARLDAPTATDAPRSWVRAI